jgi:hypothetical protein
MSASKSLTKDGFLNKSSVRSPELLVVYILIAVSLIAALVGFKKRFSVESHNRRVETVVDYLDALNLSLASGKPFDYVLQHIHVAGVTSLALTEDTVDSLRTDGSLSVTNESPYATTFSFAPGKPNLEQRFIDALTHKTLLGFTANGTDLAVNAPYLEINQLGLGLDPTQVSEAVRNGFYICPRLSNYAGATPDGILWMLQTTKDQCGGKASTLIFSGVDVLGNRNELHATADALTVTGLRYGSIEFGKQIGDDVLSRLAADDTVRVHSIGGNEMPTMDIPTAISRFGLAARERSIRVCYIRFFIGGAAGEPDVLKTNIAFLHSVRSTLTDGGLALGPAHAYQQNPLGGRVMIILMSLGAAAGAALLVRQFSGISGMPFWILLGMGIVVSTVLAAKGATPIGREILALVAAMCFPSLGLLRCRVPDSTDLPLSPSASLLAAIVQFAKISTWTFGGILLVVGLLADRLFMIKVYEFAGIRVAVFTPILMVGLYYVFGLETLGDEAAWQDRRDLFKFQWQKLVASPVLVGQVVLGILGLAIVGVILVRSGNDPGIGVSSTELGFRALLNKVLSVRPRTKEFLFGHPLLVIGLAFAYQGRRKPLVLFLLAGAIGQGSLLNTFCHIHTPLTISVIRAVIGLFLGAFIGAAAYLVLQRFVKPEAPPQLVLA